MKNKRIIKVPLKELKALLRKHKYIRNKEIAEHFGVKKSYITDFLKKHGLTTVSTRNKIV